MDKEIRSQRANVRFFVLPLPAFRETVDCLEHHRGPPANRAKVPPSMLIHPSATIVPDPKLTFTTSPEGIILRCRCIQAIRRLILSTEDLITRSSPLYDPMAFATRFEVAMHSSRVGAASRTHNAAAAATNSIHEAWLGRRYVIAVRFARNVHVKKRIGQMSSRFRLRLTRWNARLK